AKRRWAYHSYCAVQWRAVSRIASSLSRGGIEVLNRTYSPSFCAASASSGLRSSALNGPRMPLRGPAMILSATSFCSGVMVSGDSGLKRWVSIWATPGAVDLRLSAFAAGIARREPDGGGERKDRERAGAERQEGECAVAGEIPGEAAENRHDHRAAIGEREHGGGDAVHVLGRAQERRQRQHQHEG